MNTQGRFISAWSVVASVNNNTTATATKAAPGVNQRHLLTGYSVSCDNAPTTGVSVTIASAATTIDRVEIPAAQFSPIVVNYGAPIQCGINESASISLPAIGGTVRGTVTLRGFTVYE